MENLDKLRTLADNLETFNWDSSAKLVRDVVAELERFEKERERVGIMKMRIHQLRASLKKAKRASNAWYDNWQQSNEQLKELERKLEETRACQGKLEKAEERITTLAARLALRRKRLDEAAEKHKIDLERLKRRVRERDEAYAQIRSLETINAEYVERFQEQKDRIQGLEAENRRLWDNLRKARYMASPKRVAEVDLEPLHAPVQHYRMPQECPECDGDLWLCAGEATELWGDVTESLRNTRNELRARARELSDTETELERVQAQLVDVETTLAKQITRYEERMRVKERRIEQQAEHIRELEGVVGRRNLRVKELEKNLNEADELDLVPRKMFRDVMVKKENLKQELKERTRERDEADVRVCDLEDELEACKRTCSRVQARLDNIVRFVNDQWDNEQAFAEDDAAENEDIPF